MKMNVRQIRKSRGWTIDQLAAESGLSRGFISQVETGQRLPSVDTLQALAAALRVQVTDLIDAGEQAADLARLYRIIAELSPEQRETFIRMGEGLVPKR